MNIYLYCKAEIAKHEAEITKLKAETAKLEAERTKLKAKYAKREAETTKLKAKNAKRDAEIAKLLSNQSAQIELVKEIRSEGLGLMNYRKLLLIIRLDEIRKIRKRNARRETRRETP